MLTTTGATAPLAQERRRAAGLIEDDERALPLLQDLHHAGVDTNRALAVALNLRGIPSEQGRPWQVQTAAALRCRLVLLGAEPPSARTPPVPRRHRRKH